MCRFPVHLRLCSHGKRTGTHTHTVTTSGRPDALRLPVIPIVASSPKGGRVGVFFSPLFRFSKKSAVSSGAPERLKKTTPGVAVNHHLISLPSERRCFLSTQRLEGVDSSTFSSILKEALTFSKQNSRSTTSGDRFFDPTVISSHPCLTPRTRVCDRSRKINEF